jgi:hypothetical protein
LSCGWQVTREPIFEDLRVKREVVTDTRRAAQITLGHVPTEHLENSFINVIKGEYDSVIRCLQRIIDRLKPARETEEIQ